MQLHIRNAAGHHSLVHIKPGAQRALAAADGHARVVDLNVLTQQRHIGPAEVGIQLARPGLPRRLAGAQQRCAQHRTQAKALPPGRWRRRVQSKVVALAGVAQQSLYLGQYQRRGAAQLVGPAQRAVAQHDFSLRQHPVGKGVALAVRGQTQAGDLEQAIAAAANVQLCAVNHQLLQPQAPC